MDELVTSAISNWAPRFTTNGVAVSDFERITRDLDHWSDWCEAWSNVAAEHKALAEEAEAAVWGISLGGYYAPRVAAGDERVKACVALAGPYNLGACWEDLPALTRDAFRVRSHLPNAEQARAYARTLGLEGHAPSIRCPLLVIAGKRDRLFPWVDAERLVAEAEGPATLLLLERGNHGCMNVAALHRYKTADWVARQLGVI